MQIVEQEIGTLMIGLEPGDSEQLRRIVLVHLPSALSRFYQKNLEYGDTANELAEIGQLSDLLRKVGKLKQHWMNGVQLTSEGVEEVLDDMIGHCLLSLDFVHEGKIAKEESKKVLDA